MAWTRRCNYINRLWPELTVFLIEPLSVITSEVEGVQHTNHRSGEDSIFSCFRTRLRQREWAHP